MPTIEKGIPIPGSEPVEAYGFARMEVGDSFAVPVEQARALRNAIAAFCRRNTVRATSARFHGEPAEDFKFTTRKDPCGSGMIRVWRVEK